MFKTTFFMLMVILSLSLFAGEEDIKQNISKCKYKDANACHLVAVDYYLALNDVKKAMPFFIKACELGEGLACYSAGLIITKDEVSRVYFDKGCKLENKESCKKLENLK